MEAAPHRHAKVLCFGPGDSAHRKCAIASQRCGGGLGRELPISSNRDFGLTHPETLIDGNLMGGFFIVSAFAVLHRATHHEGSGRDPCVFQTVSRVQPGFRFGLRRNCDGRRCNHAGRRGPPTGGGTGFRDFKKRITPARSTSPNSAPAIPSGLQFARCLRVRNPFAGESAPSGIDQALDVLGVRAFGNIKPLSQGKEVFQILGQGLLRNTERNDSFLAVESMANFAENVGRRGRVLRQNQDEGASRLDAFHDGGGENPPQAQYFWELSSR